MNYDLCEKNILVTGGTGQIGSFLVEKLVREKAHVTVLGRSSRNLKEIGSLVKDNMVNFVECDLTDQQSIEKTAPLLDGINYLVHMYTNMSLNSKNILENAKNSIISNLQVIPLLLKHLKHLDGICYSSSIAVYGVPAYIPVDEKCPMEPNNFYGCGKFGAEKYLQLFSDKESIPLTILRYVPIFGPRNRSNQVLSRFIINALHNLPITLFDSGKHFKDFLYISDAINATLTAINKNESDDYNIGSGVKCTMLKLAETIIRITNSSSDIIYADAHKDYDFVINITKAKQKLDFTPRISLEEGIAKEVEWYKNLGNHALRDGQIYHNL